MAEPLGARPGRHLRRLNNSVSDTDFRKFGVRHRFYVRLTPIRARVYRLSAMSVRPRPAWLPPPDGSRDLRVEDPTNLWVVHLAGRMLLPLALKARISANMVSVAGLAVGTGAALAYLGWRDPALATLGFLLTIAWLVFEGSRNVRGPAARERAGSFMDACAITGLPDPYLALGASFDTPQACITGTMPARPRRSGQPLASERSRPPPGPRRSASEELPLRPIRDAPYGGSPARSTASPPFRLALSPHPPTPRLSALLRSSAPA